MEDVILHVVIPGTWSIYKWLDQLDDPKSLHGKRLEITSSFPLKKLVVWSSMSISLSEFICLSKFSFTKICTKKTSSTAMTVGENKTTSWCHSSSRSVDSSDSKKPFPNFNDKQTTQREIHRNHSKIFFQHTRREHPFGNPPFAHYERNPEL